MSGPIVRKYGFPNFEKIFGERALEHGADEAEEAAPDAETPAAEPAKAKKPGGSAKPASKPKKKS